MSYKIVIMISFILEVLKNIQNIVKHLCFFFINWLFINLFNLKDLFVFPLLNVPKCLYFSL